jgi:hypothetical protein
MLRSILGGIAGYVVMFILIFVMFTALYLALGADRAFTPGTYQVSVLWIAVSTVLGTIAAIAGGYMAALVGKGMTAVKVLAGIILVMGLITVAMVAMTPAPTDARTADVPNVEAMTKAQTPVWIAILNPIIGIVGAMIGGRMRREV